MRSDGEAAAGTSDVSVGVADGTPAAPAGACGTGRAARATSCCQSTIVQRWVWQKTAIQPFTARLPSSLRKRIER